jgi:HK97 family phage major capsid protein
MTIFAKREQRASLAKEVRNLLDQNPGKLWNASHQATYDSKMSDIERLDAEIVAAEAQARKDAEDRFSDAERLSPSAAREAEKAGPRAIYQKWLRHGERALTAEDWSAIRATMSTTTGSEGGFTVQTDVAKTVADALKGYGGMRAVAEVFQTAQGNPMSFPTTDGTAEVGEQIAENTTATSQDIAFGAVSLTTYKFSSKVIAVPIELLQDSSIDVEALVQKRFVDRLGRITNQRFTTGTGSGQPNGIVTAAGSGKVGITGQTLTVIYDDLVDLVESVDFAYQDLGRCRFMFNQQSRKVVRKIKDTSGRPIWVPSYEAGIKEGVPDTLPGYPVQLNNDMAVMAANAKSILFGDFSFYKIRDVLDLQLFRFADSAYVKLGQIGFLAWSRAAGNFVDVGGAVKFYQNSAT